jgi:hypothetical protein
LGWNDQTVLSRHFEERSDEESLKAEPIDLLVSEGAASAEPFSGRKLA